MTEEEYAEAWIKLRAKETGRLRASKLASYDLNPNEAKAIVKWLEDKREGTIFDIANALKMPFGLAKRYCAFLAQRGDLKSDPSHDILIYSVREDKRFGDIQGENE